MDAIIFILCMIMLIISSITDIRTREVPDFMNFIFISLGLGYHLFESLIYWTWLPIAESVLGLLVFLGLAYAMFYTGQWGGGDSKLLMGFGAVLGIPLAIPITNTFSYWLSNPPFIIVFVIMTFLVGAIYGLVWVLFHIIKNKKKTFKRMGELLKEKQSVFAKKIVLVISILLFIGIIVFPAFQLKVFFALCAILIWSSLYLSVLIKAVEEICMTKKIPISKLTVGDWVVDEVNVNGERICGPDDLGIEKEQIEELKILSGMGKLKKITIREGIPFVPSFLMGFILTFFVIDKIVLLFL